MNDDRRKEDADSHWLKPGPIISLFFLFLIVVSLGSGISGNTDRENFQETVGAEHAQHMAALAVILDQLRDCRK